MVLKFGAVVVMASILPGITHLYADENSSRLDDEFTRQSAAQVALATQAQQCDLRSSVWLDKFVAAVKQRLSGHFKDVRPTWTTVDSDAISSQIIYGATYGAKSDIGSPGADPTDMEKVGEQSLSKSMACQVIQYRKSDLLYLDGIIDGGGS